MVRLFVKKMLKTQQAYDATLFQTPRFGLSKGYEPVYRLTVNATTHDEALASIYRTFNVSDLLPKDYKARYVGTGDVVLIDEGIYGQTYYKLCSEGWKKINRVHVR
ncbi:YodL domain-containing protein [Anoxybacteroides tepidamans]|uniref:YodL domain-containing protein n=1 Tax=Anoxybacteroides tepidamans TaxID=265948 RepID=UPI000489875B|nr:YodL domain-containing protein [Anoxybacillus tepidamans]